MRGRSSLLLLLVVVALTGCAENVPAVDGAAPEVLQPVRTVETVAPATVVASLTPQKPCRLWLSPGLPPAFVSQLALPAGVEIVSDPQQADMRIAFTNQPGDTGWVYVLAAPFPTVRDGVSLEELQAIAAGQAKGELRDVTLLVSIEGKAMLQEKGFTVSEKTVHPVDPQEMLETAWGQPDTWALLPFEELEPRWKVLAVDEKSPLRAEFAPDNYALTGFIGLSGEHQALEDFREEVQLPPGNYDPEKKTTLLMTGVTALTRATAARMDELGTTYPGEDIRPWMISADLTHISNEVSFNPDCPPADFRKHVMHFCSRPEYIELLEDVGVNVVELSGNHLVDWGRPAFLYSLELYAERGWTVFAGGVNQEAARAPVFFTHNGNRLAFIGCNPAGPEMVWATADRPGVADCDLDWMEEQVRQLRSDGYLPVVTFQYNESYGAVPGAGQRRDFERMSAAGAVIVSGSQAHHPQSMAFTEQGFIHFGLGNLFFDQMRMPDGISAPAIFDTDLPVAGTRLEFLDWHVFYDGRYIGTQLFTAVLEDYARPRPMTMNEREVFLTRMFQSSGWQVYP